MAPCGPSKTCKVLSRKEMLVGAVGIENNTDRNLKDLEEMLGNAKALKRNNRERKGILIGPSVFSVLKFFRCVLSRCPKSGVGFGSNFAARMASRQPSLSWKRESICMIEGSSYSPTDFE